MVREVTKTIATMSREIMYDDGSGPRVKVEYDSGYQLGKDPERYIKLNGVGSDDILIRISDIDFVVDAMREAQRLDELIS